MVFTSTGKKTIRAQITTFERIPSPSQITNNGAIATMGTAWLATRYGDKTLSRERDFASAYPTTVAKMVPASSPRTISISVIPV
jgi:hypothetical protein